MGIKLGKARKLQSSDIKVMFPFFEAPQMDYAGFSAMIAERFEDAPILLRTCEALVDNIESIEAGNGPVLWFQGMIAKSVVSLLITMGRIEAAKIFLRAAVENWDQERFREIHSMLLLADDDSDRLDVVDRPWLDYQIYNRGHKTTMLLFCGLAERFGVELSAVALWLRSLPVNLVYIRDFDRTLYLGGIRSLGNLEESIAVLKRDLAAMGTERSIVMGNSGGVYGALHYAHLMQASGVLCFAGPTSLNAGRQEASERPVYDGVQQRIATGELKEPDLRAYYSENSVPVRYFYAEHYEFDAVQVDTIANLPNISIEPLRNYERHVIIGEMARRNQLTTVLADAADVTLKGLNRAGTLVT